MNTCNVPGTSEAALALLEVGSGAKVLDLGCYHGDVSRELLRRGCQVSSCDLVEYPGTELLPDFHKVDANVKLPFADEKYDAIICTEVIEHLENPTNLLRECGRLLKGGGTLVLSTPNIGSAISRIVFLVTGEYPQFHELHFREWNHISPVSVTWIERSAEKFGLEVQVVTSEASGLGWKRRLLFWVAYPFFALAAKRQAGLFTADHTLILRFKKRMDPR